MNAASVQPVAALDGAGYRVGRTTILEPANLSISQGEFVGIIGPNGAGKSTLLNLFNATLHPSVGRTWLFGRNPWAFSERERVRMRSRAAMVFQRSEYNAGIPLTVRDVVAMGRLGARGLLGRRSARDDACVDESLTRLGMTHLAQRVFRSLSGGEQQKVQLARALAQQPDLLLLDEPTTGLDLDWQERLVKLTSEVSRSLAMPVVMTTHTLNHLPVCCQRIVLLRGGRILFDGPVDEALTVERVSTLYGCPVEIIAHRGRRYCMGIPEDAAP